MKTNGYILVEGQSIKELVKSYNRDKAKIEGIVKKLGSDRLTAIRQGRIKKEGFNIIFRTVKSERGNWSYEVLIIIKPEKQSFGYFSFTIIDDPIRYNKREVILWEASIEGLRSQNTSDKNPMIIKQHALERYYQRALQEEFPGIKEATKRVILEDLISFSSDIPSRTITIKEKNICFVAKCGLFLAYTRQNGDIDDSKPIIFNTFISHKEIEEEQRTNQLEARKIQDALEKMYP